MSDWAKIGKTLNDWADISSLWRARQDRTLLWAANKLTHKNGVLIADEVGLGKTWLAFAIVFATLSQGGSVVILVPPGLMDQWKSEFNKIHNALKEVGAWTDDKPELLCLKSYFDLFNANLKYGSLPKLILMSHMFGIPQRLGDNSRNERWALPIAVRNLINKQLSKRQLQGFNDIKNDTRFEKQMKAAEWLVENIPTALKEEISNCERLKPSETASIFNDEEYPVARKIFNRLIGELIGSRELLIIDEAHKSRRGATDKYSEDTIKSRLSYCARDILLATSESRKVITKRVALTATPLELDAEQWDDLLARIGVDANKRKVLVDIADKFSKTVKTTTWLPNMDITELENVATTFNDHFKDLVTRRRWNEHPEIKDYVERLPTYAHLAHPHRKWTVEAIPVSKISSRERNVIAAFESLAILSKGEDVSIKMKLLGSRYSQALATHNELNEAVSAEDCKNKNTTPRDLRRIFWRRVYQKNLIQNKSLKKKPEWYLQWHPRLIQTIKLIEKLVADGDKVLVFGEYNDPLHALTRALNIRQYLREILSDTPTILPAGHHENDPDLEQWSRASDFTGVLEKLVNAERLHRKYESKRDRLRKYCKNAVEKWLTKYNRSENKESEKYFVDWLLLNLAEINQEQIFDESQRLLDSLLDMDSLQDDQDEVSEINWNQIIEAIKKDLPDKDKNSARRSAFARFLRGEVKEETRGTLKYLFNMEHLMPRVLVAQAAVGSEGLNLHEACRKVVLFHLNWNPARIEQQVGRVDREDSLWMKLFKNWKKNKIKSNEPNQIEIYTIAFNGTYDEHRHEIIKERQIMLKSQIFGELADPEILSQLPNDLSEHIANIAPYFSPP